MLLANQHAEIFPCILLDPKSNKVKFFIFGKRQILVAFAVNAIISLMRVLKNFFLNKLTAKYLQLSGTPSLR